MFILTYLLGFDQSSLITYKKLKSLDNIRKNRVNVGLKVVYILYSSKELSILLWVNNPVVGYVPIYLMVHTIFVWPLGQFTVICKFFNLHMSSTYRMY